MFKHKWWVVPYDRYGRPIVCDGMKYRTLFMAHAGCFTLNQGSMLAQRGGSWRVEPIPKDAGLL